MPTHTQQVLLAQEAGQQPEPDKKPDKKPAAKKQ